MIGVFDSGLGGLSVLRELRRLMPEEDYVYYADSANCPYGDKSPEFITRRSRSIVDKLLAKGAGIVVVACNTATAAAISTLRSEYSVPFIGMEPAVKPAALGTRTGVIGVLATAGTLKGSKYLKTKSDYEDGCRIVEKVGRGFVELVESGRLEGPETEAAVRACLWPLLEEGADTVVLGCTHYPLLLPVLEKEAATWTALHPGRPVRFIDPAPAVARQTLKVMEEKGLRTQGSGLVELISSGGEEPLHSFYEMISKQ